MELASLPGNVREHLADGVLDAFMGIGGDHQEPFKPAVFQALEEGVPGRLGLIVIDAEAKNFAMPFLVRSISDHESPGDDPVINTYLEISGIHSQERVIASQRTFTELSDLTTTILVPINYIIDMILNKPADPLTIFVLPKNDGAEYAIKRKSKDIKNGFMSWDEWELALDMGANSIKINDDEYKIGSNSQEFIYNVSDKNKKVRFEVPKEDLKEIKDIQKLKENLKSYRAFVGEKEKEEAWERKQK
jgi:hypothetical protein